MGDAVIVSAVRTAVGEGKKGVLGVLPIAEIGKAPVLEALKRSGIDAGDVDDLVLGEVMHGGGCVARYIAAEAGLTQIPGLAVQRHCATGLQAVNSVAADIRAGMTRVAIAGGAENMTQTPSLSMPSPMPWGGVQPWISLTHPDSEEAPAMVMGITVGENTAVECGITREEQDNWAYHSHRRAVAAIDAGRFTDEIVPVEVPVGRRGETVVFDTDERPRRDTSPERLAALRPVFKPDGTVTAGNSSGLNDGAAALVVTDDGYASEHGLEPLAVIRSWAAVGVEPRRTGLAPTVAIPRAVERAGLRLDDIALFEINEAFASMAVACTRELGLDHEQVNVNGGAVALGHPVAATGAKLLVTLVHELRRRGGGYGVVSLCAGGGMGAATVVEVLPPVG
jgi:acetyl-CoA acetyltransferase family protein